jgi:hypothetical protein
MTIKQENLIEREYADIHLEKRLRTFDKDLHQKLKNSVFA